MPRPALAVVILCGLSACATTHGAATKTSVDAVAQDESQRQKVLSAIRKGDTPTEAMAKVADGPRDAKPTPDQPAPK